MTSIPAVVIPADRPATLGIARSLGQRNIPVFAVDSNRREYGLASKYVQARPLPNADDSDENRLQFLIDLGKQLGHAVLFPVRDDDVLLCSRCRKELGTYYSYVMPEESTIADLVTKDGLQRMAQISDIEAPRMIIPKNREHLATILNDLPYPVILKPVFSPSWLRPEIKSLLRDNPLSSPPKVAFCDNPEKLLWTYDRISAFDARVIVQEIIPGEDDRLAYCCFYVDRQGRPLAFFAGRKLRVLPVGFGSATYARSVLDSELERITFKLLSGTGYQGLGGTEFKRDPRDERYKLIEFNARFGLWDSLATRCGVDIPYIAYRDALGLSVEPRLIYREGVIWVDSQRDFRAFLIHRRRHRMTWLSWLRSLRGEKDWAVYSPQDWKPALVATTQLLTSLWNHIKKKLQHISENSLDDVREGQGRGYDQNRQ